MLVLIGAKSRKRQLYCQTLSMFILILRTDLHIWAFNFFTFLPHWWINVELIIRRFLSTNRTLICDASLKHLSNNLLIDLLKSTHQTQIIYFFNLMRVNFVFSRTTLTQRSLFFSLALSRISIVPILSTVFFINPQIILRKYLLW